MSKEIKKSLHKISGVYEIKNTLNNKRYIGSSVNIQKRWYAHKRMLNLNTHPNKHLQAAWNKLILLQMK
jgi:predicted GIY-YIG superfamily endonuclease